MGRFYVSAEFVKGNKIVIAGTEAHHILEVMRLRKLDKVVAFDGTGKEYIGFITDIKKKALEVEIVETRAPVSLSNSRLTLIQALPKKERMESIVEKATELGVSALVPVITGRTIPKWTDPKRRERVSRWRKIALEASKQCGRPDIPFVKEIGDLAGAIKDSSDYDLCLIAALSDEAILLKDAISGFKGGKVAIAIGPEGDFTPDEIALARNAGFKLVNLGPRVLKSDTAGLAVLAILNYEFQDR